MILMHVGGVTRILDWLTRAWLWMVIFVYFTRTVRQLRRIHKLTESLGQVLIDASGDSVIVSQIGSCWWVATMTRRRTELSERTAALRC